MANTFALILTLATLFTGIIWCLDRFKFAPARKRKLKKLEEMTKGSIDQEELKRQFASQVGWKQVHLFFLC